MLKVKWIKLSWLDSMHCLWHESYDCNWSWKRYFVCQTHCSLIVVIHFIFTISHLHPKSKLHINYIYQSLTFVRLLGEPLLFNQMQLTFFRVPCKIMHQWPLVLSGVMSQHSPDCWALVRVPLLDSGLHLGKHPGQLLVLLLGDLLWCLANGVMLLTAVLDRVSSRYDFCKI